MAPASPFSPLSRVVQPGTSTSFASHRVWAATLTYQWRKNGANLANAATTLLSLNNVTSNDAGSYTVVITNSAGSHYQPRSNANRHPDGRRLCRHFETNSISLWNFFWGAGNGVADYTTNWAFD